MSSLVQLANYQFRHPRPSKDRIAECKLRQTNLEVEFCFGKDMSDVQTAIIRYPSDLTEHFSIDEIIKRTIVWLHRKQYKVSNWTRTVDFITQERIPKMALDLVTIVNYKPVKADIIPFPVN